MLKYRFDQILKALKVTNKAPPTYKDRFWEVRQVLDLCKTHIQENFVPSWVSCLDESMSIWFNRWTCPGWVFCPRKPHPFGNEYHTIACGMSGILYDFEIVEGKDHPREIPADPMDSLGKTVGLLLRLTKCLYSTGKVVILDSGFCVLQGIVEL